MVMEGRISRTCGPGCGRFVDLRDVVKVHPFFSLICSTPMYSFVAVSGYIIIALPVNSYSSFVVVFSRKGQSVRSFEQGKPCLSSVDLTSFHFLFILWIHVAQQSSWRDLWLTLQLCLLFKTYLGHPK